MSRSGSDNEIRAFILQELQDLHQGHGNFTLEANVSTPAKYPAHSEDKKSRIRETPTL